MSDIIDVKAVDSEKAESLKTVGWISYLLHLVVAVGALIPGGQWGPTLLIVALILDFVKKDDAVGTWHASHFRWRIRSVLFSGIAYAVTAPLWLLLIAPGWVAWGLISLWFLYRVLRGWLACHPAIKRLNPLKFGRSASVNKLSALAAAHRHGLAIPLTMAGNDPRALAAFAAQAPAIRKPVEGGDYCRPLVAEATTSMSSTVSKSRSRPCRTIA